MQAEIAEAYYVIFNHNSLAGGTQSQRKSHSEGNQ